MKSKKPPKQRNMIALHAFKRKAGSHRKTNKQIRAKLKRDKF